jgi:HD superfamily phosphodiesterase
MKEIFEKIWELALPLQDQRDDPGHAEVTLQYATSLAASEAGDEDIVIPAMILHDIGYSQLSKERRLSVFDKSKTDDQRRAVQIEHQNAGVILAKGLLVKAEYPFALVPEILEIISQHDTRKGFISKNEGLVRDSDKLWRFSKKAFEAGATRNKDRQESADAQEKRLKDLEAEIDKSGYFYSERAKQLAREELAARKSEPPTRP